MRSVLVIVLAIGGCKFDPLIRTAPSDGDGHPSDGNPGGEPAVDAMVDAMVDATGVDPRCVAHATMVGTGGHHYFATANKSWSGAESECQSFFGHLVKVESLEENNFIKA